MSEKLICDKCARDIVSIEIPGETLAICSPCRIERVPGPNRTAYIEGNLGVIKAQIRVSPKEAMEIVMTALDKGELGAVICDKLGWTAQTPKGLLPNIPVGAKVRLTIEVLDEGRPQSDIVIAPAGLKL